MYIVHYFAADSTPYDTDYNIENTFQVLNLLLNNYLIDLIKTQ